MNEKNKRDSDALERLIGQYLDGSISSPDLANLETELAGSADARKRLRFAANIEEGLFDWVLIESESQSEQENTFKVSPESSLVPTNWWPWSALITLAATVAVVWFSIQSLRQSETGSKRSISKSVIIENDVNQILEPTYVAMVIDKVDAKFDGLPFDGISDLETGDYTLLQGFVHLQFKNGATMLLSAPAKFSIENESSFCLYDGAMRAVVPQGNFDFQLSSPGVKFQNLGTEFSIRADSLEKRSEINVYQGRVISKFTGNDEVVQALVSGQAAIYHNGIVEFGKAEPDNFIKPGSIGFKRWQSSHVRLEGEPDLIGYFPFIESEPGVVQNLVQHAELCEFEKVSDGRIGAATWVEGRWPGKRALMFETDRDYVEISFPGQYSELTIATWVKLDRISNIYNTIINSNGWSQGGVHFQLNRFGGPWISSFDAQLQEINGNLPVGKWVHLAATVSKKTMTGHTFLNGECVSTSRLPEGTIIRPGQCRIGNWFNPNGKRESRALSGRIDELMVWKKALPVEKIRDLFRDGLPKTDLNYVDTSVKPYPLP